MRRHVILTIAIALTVTGPASAACPGDTDGNRIVTIDEIISAVNSALYGCEALPTPTPTAIPASCPAPFDRDTRTDAGLCTYEGYATIGVIFDAIWVGDGSNVCVSYLLGIAGYAWCGYVTDANHVTLAALYGPGREPVSATGVVRLRGGSFAAMEVNHDSPAFILPKYGELTGYLGNLTTSRLPATNGYVVALRNILAHFRAHQ